MTDVFMRLGDFGFSIDTAMFQTLRESHKWRWEPVSRVGRKPVLHDVGADTSRIVMAGLVYPYWRGGVGQLSRLKALADRREPVLLIDGFGANWGLFVVESLEIGHSIFTTSPTAKKQSFTITLKEQPQDA